MKKISLLLLVIALGFSGNAQKKVGDATLPVTTNFNGNELVLNGAGIREKLWIDLYAAGLYLEQKSQDANAILNSNKPMALKLHIVSKLITSEKMTEAVTEGFKNSTNGNTAPIQNEIDQILGFFKEDIKKNDVFDLVYVPGKGIVAYKNGKEKGVVEGKDFKKALFGIWLSNRPADDDLKKNLLSVK